MPDGFIVDAFVDRRGSGWDAADELSGALELEVALGPKSAIGKRSVPIADATCMSKASLDGVEASARESKSGFGLGLERLVQFVTGVANIRDVIPFPRTPGNVEF